MSKSIRILSFYSLMALLILTTGCVNTKEMHRDTQSDAVDVKEEYADYETYKASGKTYYLKDSSESYTERGQASWYGQAFQGRRTASGEKFNMYQHTAAHSSMPFYSYVRVTNLSNGKSVTVQITDRLPKHKTRIIDLSYAAAKEIDMYRAGIAKVKIERVYLKE